MSYLDRMQQYRQQFDSGRDEVPSSVSLTNIPPDQTENIFKDKTGVQQDELAEKATAPVTTIGASDLLRRGFNKLPAVQDIRDAFAKSSDFADKVKSALGNEDLQSFINDPEGAIKSFAGPLKQKVIDAVNEGIESAKSQATNAIGEGAQSIGDVLPSADQAVDFTQRLSNAAGQGIGEGIQRGIFGGGTSAPSSGVASGGDEFPENNPATGDPEEEAFNIRFQKSLNEDDGPSHIATAGQNESEEGSQSQQQLDPAQEEADQFSGSAESSGTRDFAGELKQGASDLNDALENSNREAFKSLLDRDPVGEGMGQQGSSGGADASIPDNTGSLGATERSAVEDNIKTSDGLTEAIQKSKVGDIDAGADSMADTLTATAGEEAPELAAGLGVADAIPVIGTIADLGSIGAIVGEAVDFYANKRKEAQAEAKEQQRQTAIQEDISEEQSTLIQQGRDEASQKDQQRQTQVQNSNPLPISQSGTETN